MGTYGGVEGKFHGVLISTLNGSGQFHALKASLIKSQITFHILTSLFLMIQITVPRWQVALWAPVSVRTRRRRKKFLSLPRIGFRLPNPATLLTQLGNLPLFRSSWSPKSRLVSRTHISHKCTVMNCSSILGMEVLKASRAVSKIWSWVPWVCIPRITVLARTSSNLSGRQTGNPCHAWNY
jgi:hypothetical protein